MSEFQFLLDDLERRARSDARLDDPGVGLKHKKMAYFRLIIRNDGRIIKEKIALAKAREKRRKLRGKL
ncbi:MAG: hypothetical protein AB1553_00370 [Nitrospirota bacterium]